MKEINENEIEKAVGGTGTTEGEGTPHESNDEACPDISYLYPDTVAQIDRALNRQVPRSCGMCKYFNRSPGGTSGVCTRGN